jgi:hypothetical protein
LAAHVSFVPARHLAARPRLEQLAARLGPGHRVVHWDSSAREPAAVASALLVEATGVRPADPEFALAAFLVHLRERSERLLVMIDDLDGIPPSTLQWLRETLDSSGGALRAVAATSDDASAARAAARLGLTLSIAKPSGARLQPFPHWLGLAALCALLASVLLLVVLQ